MAAHYTYLNPITHDQNVQKIIGAAIVAILILALGSLAASAVRSKQDREKHIIPGKFSLTTFFDFVMSAFISYHDSIAGKANRKYVPLSATVFLFLFTSNILGLVPGFPAVTTTVWVNVAMALVVFAAFNIYGVREHGFTRYIKHFAGPVWWLAWFIFPLEIISTCLRILTLNLRLFWNMSADHMVLGVFTDLFTYVVPVIFYGLGTFVSFMQAFVFTTLTIVYIFLAVQHGEEEHH